RTARSRRAQARPPRRGRSSTGRCLSDRACRRSLCPVRALPRSVLVAAALLCGTLVAWIVTVQRMRGMNAGPGTDLGGLGWYLGIWVTMMAAMMLPSATPMVLLFSRISTERQRRGQPFVPTSVFVAGYLATSTVYGL